MAEKTIRNKTGNIRVINHWLDVETEIRGKQGRDCLMSVGRKIAEGFSEHVNDEDIIDTGFYLDSVYLNGLGMSSFPNTRPTGNYFGHNHTKRMQRRVRASKIPIRKAKDAIIVGVAASYANFLEQKRGQALFGGLLKAQKYYGGSIRMRIDRKEDPIV